MDQKNFIIAIVLSVLIIVGWQAVFQPAKTPVNNTQHYSAEFGWSASDPGVKLPGPDTLWTADSTTVAPGKPVRLTWDNGQGVIFALDIAIDEFFMFDVKQSVENKSDKPVTV